MNINVLTIPSRTDRHKEIIEQFQKFDLSYKMYMGNITDSKFEDLFINFKKVIKDNITKEYTIIVEDDHIFPEGFSIPYLNDIIQQGKRLKADIIIGGVDDCNWIQKSEESNLLKIQNYRGSQFIIVFRKFYPEIVNRLPLEFYETFLSQSLKCNKYLAFPFLSYQSNSKSNFGRSGDITRGFKEKELEIQTKILT